MRKAKRNENSVLLALGDALRARRLELNLTQEDVARSCDLHRTYVTEIEGGLRNVSFLTLMRVVAALNCPLSHIVIEKERILREEFGS